MRKKWHLELYNQWPAVFSPDRFNWSDFTFIQVYVESARYRPMKVFELSLALLGFTVVIARESPHKEG